MSTINCKDGWSKQKGGKTLTITNQSRFSEIAVDMYAATWMSTQKEYAPGIRYYSKHTVEPDTTKEVHIEYEGCVKPGTAANHGQLWSITVGTTNIFTMGHNCENCPAGDNANSFDHITVTMVDGPYEQPAVSKVEWSND